MIHKILKDPIYALSVIGAMLRGTFYSLFYGFFTKNVKIKLPFKPFARVKIIGPGTVFIDRNCVVGLSAFKGLTIITLTGEAVVKIGKNCHLEGLTIRCHNRVEVGDDTMTAVSLIQDVYFVNTEQLKSNLKSKLSEKSGIIIGKNVWLTNGAIILGDSLIGDDCVLSVGSLCKETELKPGTLASGNPVLRGVPIENLLKFKDK